MRRIILLLALLVVLIIVSAGFVSGAGPVTGCTCTDWAVEQESNNCDSTCEYAICTGANICSCTSTSDISSTDCSNPICPHPEFNEYGDHAYYPGSKYDAGDAQSGTKSCCGNQIGEKYVYSGYAGGACCDSLDDCGTSTGACITTGLLYPGQPSKVCRQSTGAARDDWTTCSSGSIYANEIHTVVGNDYCCVDSGGWKWVGPECSCSYSQSVCLNTASGGCAGYWIEATENPLGDYDKCCTGALKGVQEYPGDGYYDPNTGTWNCGTLDSGSTSDCFVDKYLFP